ncbi:LamG domain-containing protein, partial [Patescibacteria group bacterium]
MKHSTKKLSTLIKLSTLVALVAVPVFAYFIFNVSAGTVWNKTLNSNPDLQDGLVGHWTFDGPDMISNVADISGQGNNGSLVGQTSTTTSPGKIGQALDFDGDDDYVNVGDSADLDITENITMSTWVKLDKIDASEQGILSKTDSSSWGVYDLIYDGNNGKVFRVEISGLTDTQVYGSIVPTVDTWYNVVGTYDGSNLCVYVNGVQDDCDPSTGTIDTNNLPLRLGVHRNLYMDGAVDDTRIYNRALSADEINRLYHLGATTHINKTLNSNPDLQDGLVGHW